MLKSKVADFDVIFMSFWCHFGNILVSLLWHFDDILVSFWCHYYGNGILMLKYEGADLDVILKVILDVILVSFWCHFSVIIMAMRYG